MKPQFYYEWGNEPAGYVSTGAYVDGVFKSTGWRIKAEITRTGLPYHNPHS